MKGAIRSLIAVIVLVAMAAGVDQAHLAAAAATAKEVFSPEDVINTRFATSAELSPDAGWIAYTVSVARPIDDDPGGAYSELHVVSTETGEQRPFVTGKVNVSSVQWSPDGKAISFRMRRGDKAKTQVWTIRVDGGEAVQATDCKSDVISYRWHPSGARLAFTAVEPESEQKKELVKKGYDFIYYEEDIEHRNLYMVDVVDYRAEGEPQRITTDITVWAFEFSPDGRHIALGASEKNLVDQSYVFQRIYLYDTQSGTYRKWSDNPGKLGNFKFSPNGKRIAYTAALSASDHAVSQVLVQPVDGNQALNLTEPEFAGHVEWVAWKNDDTVVYLAGEGMWNTLSSVKATGGKRGPILHSEQTGFVFGAPSYTRGFAAMAFTASSPTFANEVFYWTGKGKPQRMTDLNPWIAERKLARGEIVKYAARDGLEVEGLLYYPVDYQPGSRHPLVVEVHGGPESHYTDGWCTNYSNPVQVLCGRGYFVFLPNYRSSTGYGVARPFSTLGDPAGKEFDDVADGIHHLVNRGLVDPARVGLGGGSYGGYAAAWFSSYYTDLVKAVVMFVGISDLVSKRSTTDIPYEELLVHSGKKLEDMWDLSMKRSPVYYAHQSKTAVLILGGAADTRVHPSQSIEYYRQLKMNGHPAARLVQYPGEGHGNSKLPGRRDVLLRTLQWYDWYVKDGNPVDGPMPPYDLSGQYGLELKK
jgi:dipeptidyl aminopeptidase/acylaminoacyl peptidase